MAEMNLEYYSGEDAYSDGDVESRLLESVRQLKKGEKSEEGLLPDAGSEDAFAYLYHLSPVRENILSWYPFREGARALEIGAGPGAVTGVLCRKLAHVTSVDLSQRRCMINYLRHQDLENLEIMVGNFNEMKFAGLFDYVILNGVFEYAGSFTEGDDPYRTFLLGCSKLLKKDGKLLIAIENRLGLKYFAGAPEDHTGNYMEGLKDYKAGSGVRTFSKAEWKDLAARCGLQVSGTFYPYPDYKFPGEVFTDESLSSASYERNNWNFDSRRIALFSEKEMAAAFEKEGVLGSFMNSFLIELSFGDGSRKDDTGGGRVIYAKMNADRDKHFRIQTILREKNGRKEAVKCALCPEAEPHLLRMHRKEREMKDGLFSADGKDLTVTYLKSEKTDEGLVYPLLEGESFGKKAARAAGAGDAEKVREYFDALWALILSRNEGEGKAACSENASLADTKAAGEDPARTGEEKLTFRRVFGPEKMKKKSVCVCPANIDLILDNLVEDKGAVCILDGEWIFDFPVPAGFIQWRAVNEFYAVNGEFGRILKKEQLLSRYGIDRADSDLFRAWAQYFEKNYVGANSLAAYSKPVKTADLKDLHTFGGEVRMTSTLYIDRGQGFSEKEALHQEVSLKDGRFETEFRIPDPAHVKALRFDPLEGSCSICALTVREGKLVPVNAARTRRSRDASGRRIQVCEFLTMDPSYLVKTGKGFPQRVRVAGKAELKSEDWGLTRAGSLLEKYRRIFRI